MRFPNLLYLEELKQLTIEIWRSNFGTITRWWNDHDSGARVWTRMIALGTTTNDAATAGQIGEYVESVVGNTNAPATTNFGDMTSISLTAGDWDVSAGAFAATNGATLTDSFTFGISITSGNSATGLVIGDSEVIFPVSALGTNTSGFIACRRFSLATTTTLYAKMRAFYSGGGPPLFAGRLSARRVR